MYEEDGEKMKYFSLLLFISAFIGCSASEIPVDVDGPSKTKDATVDTSVPVDTGPDVVLVDSGQDTGLLDGTVDSAVDSGSGETDASEPYDGSPSDADTDGSASDSGVDSGLADGSPTDDGGTNDATTDSGSSEVCEMVINCNAPETVEPRDAPVSFVSTTTCDCGAPEVKEYDCYTYNGSGRYVNKTSSCDVSYENDTLHVDDTGGVADTIVWTVEAVDCETGEVVTKECYVEVTR